MRERGGDPFETRKGSFLYVSETNKHYLLLRKKLNKSGFIHFLLKIGILQLIICTYKLYLGIWFNGTGQMKAI